MTKRGVVVVGAGQAGCQTASSLRDLGFQGDITLVNEEGVLPYRRPPLSKGYLDGSVASDGLVLRRDSYYVDNRIDLLPGDRVTRICRKSRHAVLASGRRLPYSHLVLATGSRARSLEVQGGNSEGVLALRTLADAALLRARLESARRVVIVGGGFIGLEVGALALTMGVQVKLLESGARLMARAVTPFISEYIADRHGAAGMELKFQCAPTKIEHTQEALAVQTSDGGETRADLVLVAVGAAPNVALASAAGLPEDNGVLVDRQLRTADPAIFAVGDCASWHSPLGDRRVRTESIQNAVDQGRAVAAAIMGDETPYDAVPWFWTDQGDSLKLQIAGLTNPVESCAVRGDTESGSFSVLSFLGERLIGAESVNRPADHMAVRRLLANGIPLTPEQASDDDFDLRAYAAARAVELGTRA
jgi:3-phenylpropionate/trans-cinnamate dioxygenase ferredoxin reductase subunit